MELLVKSRMYSRVPEIFGWMVKIRSIQLVECSKICIGSVINWLRPYRVIRKSKRAPSAVVVSLVNQFLDLAFKSPVIKSKCSLRFDSINILSTNRFSKLFYQLIDSPNYFIN